MSVLLCQYSARLSLLLTTVDMLAIINNILLLRRKRGSPRNLFSLEGAASILKSKIPCALSNELVEWGHCQGQNQMWIPF